jgi:Family of unknown function (DUF5998)
MPRTRVAPDQTDALRTAIERVGYYPAVVAGAVFDALAADAVESYLIHHEPTFDNDEVRRHVTVAVLTPTRLILTHTDEHPPDDMLPRPYTSTSTEVLPLSRVTNVSVTRMVTDSPASRKTGRPPVDEAVLTVGWGALRRIDLQPANCGDPECDADHGYSGMLVNDDFSLRMSAAADGASAVADLLEFARTLNSMSSQT